MTTREPPRLARAIAGRLLPPAFREAVLGDWAEEYHGIVARGGRFAAWGYWRHLLSPDLLRLRHAARDLPVSRGPDTMLDHQRRTPGSGMGDFLQDTRIAIRSLARDRVFTATAVLVLGLGLGVSTTVFSIVHGVMLRPLEYDNADQLVAIWGERQAEQIERAPITTWDVVHLRENATMLDAVGGFFQMGSALQSDGPPTEVGFGWMSDNVLDIMGIEPMLGRNFNAEDAGQLVVILDHGIWRSRFGADSSVVGRTIRLAQQEWTVIGVLPPGKPLQLPNRGFLPQQTDIWSLVTMPTQNPNATNAWIRAVARLAPGATLEQAREELTALVASAKEQFPDRREAGFDLSMVGLLDDFTSQASSALWLLAGGAGILLAIVLTNVANLLLLRGAMRRHITAIRAVLGAGRWRLAQLALLEGAILSFLGTALGLVIAAVITGWIRTAPPPGLPRVENLQLDGTVFAFAGLAALVATVVFGLIPGYAMSRRNLVGVLRRQVAGGRPVRRVGTLIIAEVALSLALLVGAGLLVRTMTRMGEIDPGFRPESVLTFRVSLPNQGMTREEIAGVVRTLEERIGALPGVASTGLVQALPLTGALSTGPYAVSIGELGEGDTGIQANYRYATPDYLQTIGARLVAGRHLVEQDPQTAVMIDSEFARTLWPGANAVDREFAASPFFSEPAMYTVVGVVEPLRQESLRQSGQATIYFSARHFTPLYMWATIRTMIAPTTLVDPIRRLLPEVHPDLAIARAKTMTEWVADSTASTRWAMWVMTVFGLAAALLSAIGLYGVLGHLVAGRMREIGIRLALGAQRRRVVTLILRSAISLVGLGLVVGLIGSLWFSRSLETLLFGVSRIDLMSYAAGIGILGAVALLASWLPAMRATRVSPMVTLREDG